LISKSCGWTLGTRGREIVGLCRGLSIAVKHKELSVTLPGSNYAVTYYKLEGSPGLLARDMPDKDDPGLQRMNAAEFLAKAWKLAKQRAREFGWIVG
jgi:hypothetical protein